MKLITGIKENIYLIIPMICIGFWAFLYLISFNFVLEQWDLAIFYKSGMQIFIDSSKLYKVFRFYYLPSFALFFSLISLSGFVMSHYIFFFLNVFFYILIIVEYNKILKLMNLNEKLYRFILLMIISNGYIIYRQFQSNQTKVLLTVILLFIILRETRFNKENRVKDLKYYFIHYNLFIFILGIAPYFIFFLFLIYIFHEIGFKDLLKKENLKKYILIMIIFLIQNCLFIIFPNLILDYLYSAFSAGSVDFHIVDDQIVFQFIIDNIEILRYISLIIMFIIVLILNHNRKIKIDRKFSIFCLFFIFLDVFKSRDILITCLPFVLLIFVPYFNPEQTIVKFIKKNVVLLIGIFSISGIYLVFFYKEQYFGYFPFLLNYPFIYIIYYRYIILVSIMIVSLLVLYLEKRKGLENFV